MLLTTKKIFATASIKNDEQVYRKLLYQNRNKNRFDFRSHFLGFYVDLEAPKEIVENIHFCITEDVSFAI